MLFGKYPYVEHDDKKLLTMIKKGKMDLESVKISDAAKDLLQKMILYNRE